MVFFSLSSSSFVHGTMFLAPFSIFHFSLSLSLYIPFFTFSLWHKHWNSITLEMYISWILFGKFGEKFFSALFYLQMQKTGSISLLQMTRITPALCSCCLCSVFHVGVGVDIAWVFRFTSLHLCRHHHLDYGRILELFAFKMYIYIYIRALLCKTCGFIHLYTCSAACHYEYFPRKPHHCQTKNKC